MRLDFGTIVLIGGESVIKERYGWGRSEESAAALEDELEVRPEELHEFLTADLTGVEADPEFRKRLQEKLWRLISSGQFKTEKSEN